jgi:hypothetical protein
MNVFLKLWLIIFLLLCFFYSLRAQPSQYHDAALDTIGNNIAVMDSDLNGNFANSTLGSTNMLTTSNTPPMLATVNTNLAVIDNQFLTNAFSGSMGYLHPFTNTTFSAQNGLGLSNVVSQITRSNSFTFDTGAGWIDGDDEAGYEFNIPIIFQNGNSEYVANMSLSSQVVSDPDFYSVYANLDHMSSVASVLIESIIWVIFAAAMFSELQLQYDKTIGQSQVKGSSQEVFGWNSSVLTGFAFCGVVTIAVAVAVGIVLSNSTFSIAHSALSTITGSLEVNMDNTLGWDVMTLFCPVGHIVVAYFSYLTWKNLVLWPTFTLVRHTIMWLVV